MTSSSQWLSAYPSLNYIYRKLILTLFTNWRIFAFDCLPFVITTAKSISNLLPLGLYITKPWSNQLLALTNLTLLFFSFFLRLMYNIDYEFSNYNKYLQLTKFIFWYIYFLYLRRLNYNLFFFLIIKEINCVGDWGNYRISLTWLLKRTKILVCNYFPLT